MSLFNTWLTMPVEYPKKYYYIFVLPSGDDNWPYLGIYVHNKAITATHCKHPDDIVQQTKAFPSEPSEYILTRAADLRKSVIIRAFTSWVYPHELVQ